MSERRIQVNNNCIVIKNIITNQILGNKYNVTINCYIENTEHQNIELYYYWTLDGDLNILDTSYIRYHLRGVRIDWDNIDDILSNIVVGELHDKILYDNFSKMNI